MAYNIKEFPHTRTYESDLGELIRLYTELKELYKSNNEYLEQITKDIIEITTDILQKALENGEILVDFDYIEETETIKMVFDKVVR